MRYKASFALLVSIIGVSLFVHFAFWVKTVVQKQVTAAFARDETEKAYSEGYAKGYAAGTKAFSAADARAELQISAGEKAKVMYELSAAEERILKFETEYAGMAKGYNELVAGYNAGLEKSRLIREKALGAPASDPMSAITLTFEEVGALNETLRYANALVKKNNEMMSSTMEQLNATYACLEHISEKLTGTGGGQDKEKADK
jgi:hypothetical protein